MKISVRSRSILMTDPDLRDFGGLLRSKFGDIHFLWSDYHYAASVDPSAAWGLHQVRPFRIPYLSDPVHPLQRSVRAWREPTSWVPDWQVDSGRLDKAGRPLPMIANRPHACIDIVPSVVGTYRPFDMSHGALHASFDSDDAAGKAFVSAVWRLCAKFASNLLVPVSSAGEAMGPVQRQRIWCGPDALDWCRQNPQRRLSGRFRPPGSAGVPIPQDE